MESWEIIFCHTDVITNGSWILLWRVGKDTMVVNFTVESETISRLYKHVDAITSGLWILDLIVESWKSIP